MLFGEIWAPVRGICRGAISEPIAMKFAQYIGYLNCLLNFNNFIHVFIAHGYLEIGFGEPVEPSHFRV